MTPQNLKYLKIGIGAVTVLGLGYYFVTRNDNSGLTVDPTGNDNVNPSIGGFVFNARKVALDLWEEMKSTGFASFLNPHEADNIFAILKNVNQTQFGQVITAFGNLNYNDITGDQDSYNPFSSLPKLPLVKWMKTELGPDAIAILRQKYPNHF